MLYRWKIPKDLLKSLWWDGKSNAHDSVWELEFETMNSFGCFGTIVALGPGSNKYTIGARMRVQWPSSCWEQVDELEEFVREVRADAGIGK